MIEKISISDELYLGPFLASRKATKSFHSFCIFIVGLRQTKTFCCWLIMMGLSCVVSLRWVALFPLGSLLILLIADVIAIIGHWTATRVLNFLSGILSVIGGTSDGWNTFISTIRPNIITTTVCTPRYFWDQQTFSGLLTFFSWQLFRFYFRHLDA